MAEFFITARSFAAPFVSDMSERYVEASDAVSALEKFAAEYKHPCGLYAAEVWISADQYHKGGPPLARWASNQLLAYQRATDGKDSYIYHSDGPGSFQIDWRYGRRVTVEDPKGGRVVVA